MDEPRRPSQRAYEAVRAVALSPDRRPGERLKEEELAASLGVSRTPIREALRRLAAEGIVEFVPNRGAHVATWGGTDLEEIFNLRARLEGYAAFRAATRIEAAQLAQLAQLAERMDRAAASGGTRAIDRVTELNGAFHQLIVTAAHSQRLESLLAGLIQVSLAHRTFRRYSPEALGRSLAHHHELVAAMRAGDPDWAEAIMRSHIRAALAALMATNAETAQERHA